ncbi:hypothetical protein ABTY61_03445 [Kitasatospora sp. NPDC096128]|uniref:hypothetical protein n=1 Tax=Kitasatospora sp. NPDC096128 TaxID=3155547 RepID=UPI00331BC86B
MTPGSDTLRSAQEAEFDLICRKLDPHPGSRPVDRILAVRPGQDGTGGAPATPADRYQEGRA